MESLSLYIRICNVGCPLTHGNVKNSGIPGDDGHQGATASKEYRLGHCYLGRPSPTQHAFLPSYLAAPPPAPQGHASGLTGTARHDPRAPRSGKGGSRG